MQDAGPISSPDTRRDWVRLRTLVLLRWLAVAGQSITVIIASQFLCFDLPLDGCAVAISASVLLNVAASRLYPQSKRLTERAATLMLLFDLFQLSVLLYLTGGLSNPFAPLVLAPVTIAATVLSLRATLVTGFAAIALITGLIFFNRPLACTGSQSFELPRIMLFGTWMALSIGIVFLAAYARRISTESFSMSEALAATQLALERERKLTQLGGVVAAAAHELGTPLATIKLVASEMESEVADRPELRDDVRLISEQAERCRQILRDMGRAGKDDTLLRHAPLASVLEEAAAPHLGRVKRVVIRANGKIDVADVDNHPIVARHPEIIHGLRNLVQNAADHAASCIWLDMVWNEERICVQVGDDGPGYPDELIRRIGDPFLRRRGDGGDGARRSGGKEGMGLGLFISKTLLERSGGALRFANGSHEGGANEPSGAIAFVCWPREVLEVPRAVQRAGGANPQIMD